MKIAIIRRDIGNYSETFVRKNIECINAGKTVVLAEKLVGDPGWWPARPTLYLSRIPKPLRACAVHAFLLRHRVAGAVCEFLDYAIEWVPVFKRLGIPFVVLGHGFDIGRNVNRIPDYKNALLALKSARKIIVPCDYGKKILLMRAAFDADFVESIPVGIDLSKFSSPKLNRDGTRLLFVGRFVEKKSPIYLLMAFYHASKMLSSMVLDFIGDGPMLPAAKQLAACLGIEHRVNFMGSRPHGYVLHALQNARAIVQHSVTADNGDMETMPLSIQEALASGTPAVVTDHAGLPDIVQDGVTGYIVKERDVMRMAEKIVQLMKLDSESYRAMQENCITQASRFDYRTRIKRIETLLDI